MAASGYDAIVLAGGRSRRMGDIDKIGVVLDGRPLLAHACDAVAAARTLVVVGPPGLPGMPTRAVVTREDPPFAGPAAALGAGLAALGAAALGADSAGFVLVLAADVFRAGEAVAPLLVAAAECRDGVVALSSDGHRQPLLAVYRHAALAGALAAHEPLTDLGVNRVLRGLDLAELTLPDDVLADIDTPADLQRLKEHGHG